MAEGKHIGLQAALRSMMATLITWLLARTAACSLSAKVRSAGPSHEQQTSLMAMSPVFCWIEAIKAQNSCAASMIVMLADGMASRLMAPDVLVRLKASPRNDKACECSCQMRWLQGLLAPHVAGWAQECAGLHPNLGPSAGLAACLGLAPYVIVPLRVLCCAVEACLKHA